MIDHLTIRVPDLAASRRFYGRALELLGYHDSPYEDSAFVEWKDFSIAQADTDHPATRGLHIGFQAATRDKVDAWWHAMTDAGYPDDGAPGLRTEYGPDYYGSFVIDPAGNSVEAVHNKPPHGLGLIDHVWMRVRGLEPSTRFYETVAPSVGHRVTRLADRTRIHAQGASISVLEGPPTENVHLAFPVHDREAVQAFHRAGIDGGYASLGEPGERPRYHPGYYGAYLRDPDGHNIEAVFHDRSEARTG